MDRTRKLPIYARERVANVWFVDPLAREGEARVRAEPFDALELELEVLRAR